MHFSDSLDCWVVEGYAEAVAVMRSGALEVPLLPLPRGLGSVAERTALEPLWEQARHIPLYNSGQAHRRLRHELRDAFTRESVEAWRPSIRKVAEESFTGCLPAGRAEVIEDIGKPVLREVMAEVVGIPPDARAEFGRWADVTVRAGAFGTPQWSDGLLAEVVAAVTSIDRLIGEVVADARAVPAGSVLARALERRRHGEGSPSRRSQPMPARSTRPASTRPPTSSPPRRTTCSATPPSWNGLARTGGSSRRWCGRPCASRVPRWRRLFGARPGMS